MKLYHGTNGAWLNNIVQRGLEPRGSLRRSNWKETVESNPKCVYLTDSYAPYFAFNACRGKAPECAVIEIDTDLLDEDDLYADEDAMEQIGRGKDGVEGDMHQRTRWYRKHQFQMGLADGDSIWRYSLQCLGTCAHRGRIPARAITRTAYWPHHENVWLMFVWDPTISILNQGIMGARYKALTAKLFGDPQPIEFPVYTDPDGNPVSFDQQAVDAFDPSTIKGLVIEERQ